MALVRPWETRQQPLWKINLNNAPERVIQKTNLSRTELKEILDILYEHRIIN